MYVETTGAAWSASWIIRGRGRSEMPNKSFFSGHNLNLMQQKDKQSPPGGQSWAQSRDLGCQNQDKSSSV